MFTATASARRSPASRGDLGGGRSTSQGTAKGAYEPGEIESWAERLTAPDWEDSYVFFKHEDAGAGPALAKVFRELADGA